MGRPERPLDPAADVVQGFAFDLRRLRTAAGNPSYRAMARTAHYSPATLAAAAGGRRLPSLDVTLAYVHACSGCETEWRERWDQASTARQELLTRAADDGMDDTAPYRGLAPFGVADSALFFGREPLLTELRAKVADHDVVAVVGPSGSGKSSLLYAGLLPGIGSHVVCTPGADPFHECAASLAETLELPVSDLAAQMRDEPERLGCALRQIEARVLVVDQFEEIFTLCRDTRTREQFIAALMRAGREGVCVVLGLRADFYGRCAQHEDLVSVLRTSQVLVGAMSEAQLRDAIVKPAVHAKCAVESALVSRLVSEATGQAGVLPLVSHALLETWHRRRGNTVTLAGYEATGGLDRAVATTAEQVYVSLEPERQCRVKDLMLRLTALGEGTEDTKRGISRTELDDDEDTRAVLSALGAARLLVLGDDRVEIAHEALIRAWPRLRSWLDENRERVSAHRQLTQATRQWETLEYDSGVLYRGARLARAKEGLGRLTVSEQRFLDASLAAERRQQVRGRWFVAALGLLLVLVTVAAVVVFVQRQDAVEAGAVARSRQLAAEAKTMARHDVQHAIKLSLAAYQAHPTVEARSAVLSLASRRSYQAKLPLPHGVVTDVPVSPDGRLLASASEPGTVVLWDVHNRTRITELRGEFGFVTALAFDATGARLVAGTDRGELLLWDVPGRSLLATASASTSPFIDVAVSADGRWLATSAVDPGGVSELRLWDVPGLRSIEIGRTPGHTVTLAFAPDSRLLAHTSVDGAVTFYDVVSRSATGSITGTGHPAMAVAFSPDGELVVVGGQDGVVRLWSVATRSSAGELHGHTAAIGNLGFGGAGSRLYSADANGEIVVWDVSRLARIGNLHSGNPEWVTPVAASADGRFVVAGDSGMGVLVWDRLSQPYLGHTGMVTGVAYSPDARTMYSTDVDGTLVAWDTASRQARQLVTGGQTNEPWATGPVVTPDGTLLATVSGPSEVTVRDAATMAVRTRITDLRAPVTRAAFAPSGRTVAIIDNGPSIVLWDPSSGARRDVATVEIPLGVAYSADGNLLAVWFGSGRALVMDARTTTPLTVLDLRGSHVGAIAFSPDSRTLVGSTYDGTVVVWETSTWTRTMELTGHRGRVHSVAVSPDQRLIAAAGDDDTVSVWDTATGSRWATLSGHTEMITTMAWSRDGTLTTGSRDQSITPWVVDADKAVSILCAALERDFPGGGPAAGCYAR